MELIRTITSSDPAIRDRSVDDIATRLPTESLLSEIQALDDFWRNSHNLYERVRAQFFLYAIYRFHLPVRSEIPSTGLIPFEVSTQLFKRRYEEAIELLRRNVRTGGLNAAACSAFAAAYRSLAFQTLAGQVRQSVRSVRGNQWMSRIGHPDDYPLTVRRELLARSASDGSYPILKESTPVRMDLTHSAWSDIFFLGMDFPEGAKVLNISVDLAIHAAAANAPQPPIEVFFRVIDEPVLRLTSIDLAATADIANFAEMFDFARDYLGLLKAAVIASGLIPPAMEGAAQPVSSLLSRLAGPGKGIEIVTSVRNIPKGSRLAVSTNLLAGIVSVCMRATGQTKALTGELQESDRRLIAARAILGEWLGGSGGGWQDSGGVWPGIKLIQGVPAQSGDPEWGISRGRLLPAHRVLPTSEISEQARNNLQDSLVLVHGGMAQDVGPILEMVTERYLLRSGPEWQARNQAIRILDEVLGDLRAGDIHGIGSATERNFFGPIQTIIPWASNLYSETLINKARAEMQSDFWGFWMLGGMAGGGMGFIFDPRVKPLAQERMQTIMRETKKELEDAVPFAMDPVVYDFKINERGTFAELLCDRASLMPEGYYSLIVPSLLRMDPKLMVPSRRAELDRLGCASRTRPGYSGIVQDLFDRLLPSSDPGGSEVRGSLTALLQENGFDLLEHEQIRLGMQNGAIGLAQNRLPITAKIEDVRPGDVFLSAANADSELEQLGSSALRNGAVAVVSLAGGAGTRWTRGAGAVKALNPFAKYAGKYRSFVELHLAKSRRTSRLFGATVPHVITTSYLTHQPIQSHLSRHNNHGYPGEVLLSPGRSIGLRFVPTTRDLRFAWQEMSQQILDEQKQKVRESLRSALIQWAITSGEASDYTDNIPLQCLHPTGHWYELSNMLRNGVLAGLFRSRPHLKYLLLHNIDTVGVNLDPVLLGFHIKQASALTAEVVARQIEDHGGGLARLDGHLRLIEGLALPSEKLESLLSYYNTNTFWIDVDQLLAAFSLSRTDLDDAAKVTEATRRLAARMPSYITLKDVKKRWGKGQEDIFPVAQFEKLFVDMTALKELPCRYAAVARKRGQQLKEPAQLDGWLRDGSAEYAGALADWH
jgi:hypothetical protein